jgi:hypothetical protein
MGASKFSSLVEETKRKAEQNAQPTSGDSARQSQPARTPAEAQGDSAEAARGLSVLGAFLDAEGRNDLGLPATAGEVRGRWMLRHSGEPIPRDPYDGDYFGYARTGNLFVLWSSGPDRKSETEDDIVWRSGPAGGTR